MTRISLLLFSFPLLLFSATACGQQEAADSGQSEQPQPEVLLSADLPTTPTIPPEPAEFPEDPYTAQRREMVEGQIEVRGVSDPEVLAAMRRIPRHLFVPSGNQSRAYSDQPLPIGHGQTISQPYIVAYMTEILGLEQDDRVLEVGTGSGYQAAVLAEIVREVVTIEIIEDLARQASRCLDSFEYENITVLSGDGYFGWEEKAPYDAVIVTAAAEHIPPPLLAQLKPGGRMIIPVGSAGWTQNLQLVRKDEDGKVVTENLMAVRFVPLTREQR